MQKLLDQLVLQHFLRDCHEVGPPALLISDSGEGVCGVCLCASGTSRLSGSRNIAPWMPPGDARSPVPERMPARSLSAHVGSRETGGALGSPGNR